MRPEIDAYLLAHGARYTTKALRAQLISAGHEPAEVDAALAETQEARKPQLAETQALRSRFWALAFLINFLVLVVATVLVAQSSTFAGAAFLVLGSAMLLALIVTGNIGRALLHSRGLLVALLVPTVGALLLGGWCVAGMGGGSVAPSPSPSGQGGMYRHGTTVVASHVRAEGVSGPART